MIIFALIPLSFFVIFKIDKQENFDKVKNE